MCTVRATAKFRPDTARLSPPPPNLLFAQVAPGHCWLRELKVIDYSYRGSRLMLIIVFYLENRLIHL